VTNPDLPLEMLLPILDYPANDNPRLVAADWFEEHGAVERAEFIRTMCRLPDCFQVTVPQWVNKCGHKNIITYNGTRVDSCPEPVVNVLDGFLRSDLATELFGPIAKHCDATLMTRTMKGAEYILRRGWPCQLTTTMAEFMGGACLACEGRLGRTNSAGGYREFSGAYPQWEDCSVCRGSGTRPGIAATVGGWPVEKIIFTDVEPQMHNKNEWTLWREYYRQPPGFRSWILSNALFDMMNKHNQWVLFPTRELALAALSDAAVRYARAEWKKTTVAGCLPR